jgi:hypothetical protein
MGGGLSVSGAGLVSTMKKALPNPSRKGRGFLF